MGVLEAVMLCLDNSEYARNGDYSPNRLKAMVEAANYVASAKLNGHPDAAAGFLTMAGKRIDVVVALTQDVGDLMRSLDEVTIGGKANIVGALKTAQLALKNRLNKNQRQRVIVFVGSPVTTPKEEFEKLGKVLKKNNVAVDIINFGAEAANNVEALEALIKSVDNGGNSNLVNIPNGPHQLSDLVMTSPIMANSDAGGGGGGAAPAGVPSNAGAASAFPGGVDPSVDPELAMVLRMSLEEERARQQSAPADAAGAAGSGAAAAAAAAAPAAMEEDDDALLQQAIALSMAAGNDDEPAEDQSAAAPATSATSSAAKPAASSSTESKDVNMTPASADADISQALQDPSFVENLLNDIGLSSSDIQIDDILGNKNDKPKDKDPKKDDGKK